MQGRMKESSPPIRKDPFGFEKLQLGGHIT